MIELRFRLPRKSAFGTARGRNSATAKAAVVWATDKMSLVGGDCCRLVIRDGFERWMMMRML
jgi:hypothetical protein